jgi:hypothetical protein
MTGEGGAGRAAYIRPLAVAAIFIFSGQAIGFVVWELILYPDGRLLPKIVWTAVDSVAMTLAVGLLVGFVVKKHHRGRVAGMLSSLCYAIVAIAGILICFQLDSELNVFEAEKDARLYIAFALSGALLSAPFYGWLLHGRNGQALLKRVGL